MGYGNHDILDGESVIRPRARVTHVAYCALGIPQVLAMVTMMN